LFVYRSKSEKKAFTAHPSPSLHLKGAHLLKSNASVSDIKDEKKTAEREETSGQKVWQQH
jgi:hypothetical protein